MAASVAMGLAKAFRLRVDQVGGDAQGPSFVAFGDEGEEHLGLVRLGQVAQVVKGGGKLGQWGGFGLAISSQLW